MPKANKHNKLRADKSALDCLTIQSKSVILLLKDRFTYENDNYGMFYWSGHSLAIVPYEIWNVTKNVRLIPYLVLERVPPSHPTLRFTPQYEVVLLQIKGCSTPSMTCRVDKDRTYCSQSFRATHAHGRNIT